jgi:hypothetical protein
MQSALRMLLIFCIASRVPARYARSRRFAMMPSIPPSLLEPAPGIGDLQTAGTRHADRYGRNCLGRMSALIAPASCSDPVATQNATD